MPEQLQLGAGWDVLGSAVVQHFLSFFFFFTHLLYIGGIFCQMRYHLLVAISLCATRGSAVPHSWHRAHL